MTRALSVRWQVRFLAALILTLLAFSPTLAQPAAAHPLGNFTTNRYARIEVYQDRLQLHYIIDVAEIPTFQAFESIDADGDGSASETELSAYAEESANAYAEAFTLRAEAVELTLRAAEATAQLLPGQGGLEVLRIAVLYDAPISAAAGESVAIAFEDRNLADTQGWKELVVRPSEGAQVSVDAALLVERSNALLEYPAESLRSAPDMRSANFSWVAGTGSAAPVASSLQLAETGREDSGFSGIFANVTDGNVSVGFLALSLLIAFAFGAQHALGPGHGKTMVAAYLVGTRGTARHAVALGATVTLTHTSTVYLLGLVTLVAAAWVTPETVYLWMGVVAGVMVIAFGLGLFLQRSLSFRRARAASGAHRHGLFGKSHTHTSSPRPRRQESGEGSEVRAEHEHQHAAASRVTWRSLLSLGVLGGLLPCPSAVVVMVAAISQGQVLLGMLLIVAFSLGLAGVLMALGISLVIGRKVTSRGRNVFDRALVQRTVAVMPVLSAAVVTLVGVGLTLQAVGRV